jgi:hypothetical protein
MAKSILASVLAGLMSPTAYRETPYGPVQDTGNTIAGAAKAGAEFQANRQAKAQELTNQQQAAKLMTIQNNAKLVQLQAASAHAKHVMLQDQMANSQQLLSPFQEYDKLRTSATDPDQPSAFIAQNLSADDIVKPGSPYKLTDSNVVMDGTRSVFNPQTQQMEEEPTYAILNPALQDIQLSPEVTNKLNEINSQWKDIHKIVGGTVRIPVNAYVSAMHDYQAVTQGQNVLSTLANEIGANSNISLAPAVRANKNLLPALYQLTQAVAGGNVVDNRPDNLLDTILKTPNGGDLLKLMGVTPEQADQKIQDYANKRLRATELAKTGGIGDKAIAPALQVNAVISQVKSLPPKYQGTILAGINPNGMTVGELEKLKDKVLDVQKHVDDLAKTQLPESNLEAVAQSLAQGDMTSLKDVTSMRGNERTKVFARAKQLNPNFNTKDIDRKVDTQKEFTTGKAGDQIQAFNTFMGHVGELKDANDEYRRGNSPLINRPLNWIAKNAENDPVYQRWVTSIVPAVEEYQTFLANNHALTESDKKQFDKIVSGESTPAAAESAMKVMMGTAFVRLEALNDRYKRVMNQEFPDMLNQTAVDSANKLGYAGQAARFQTGGRVTGSAGGVTAGQTAQPTQTAQPFQKYSSDGKWGWDGKQWVGTGR